MTTMLEDHVICEVFESAFPQVATSDPMVKAVAKMVLKDKTHILLVAKFVANQVEKNVSKTAKLPVLAVLPPPPPVTD